MTLSAKQFQLLQDILGIWKSFIQFINHKSPSISIRGFHQKTTWENPIKTVSPSEKPTLILTNSEKKKLLKVNFLQTQVIYFKFYRDETWSIKINKIAKRRKRENVRENTL
jgi:hypothetical protein